MGYNHGLAEKIEKKRREKEAKIFKENNTPESIQQALKDYDDEAFLSDRHFCEHENVTDSVFFINKVAAPVKKQYTIDNIKEDAKEIIKRFNENESFAIFIKNSPKDLKRVFFLLHQQYTYNEIALLMGIKKDTLYKRVNRYAKKNKKNVQF